MVLTAHCQAVTTVHIGVIYFTVIRLKELYFSVYGIHAK